MKKKPFSELVIGLACIALGAVVFIAAGNLQQVRLGIGPSGFPKFIAVVLAILGLAAGTYYLKEVEAPAGYNALTLPVEITAGEGTRSFNIFADVNGNVADIQQTDGVHTEKVYDLTHTVVHNSKGVELPSTGGEGTFWLITIGTLLAIGFAVFLITHKKMSVYTD